MIGSVILVILGVMALIGIGNNAVKDFGVPVIALVLVFAAIVGLNFLPVVTWGNFSFSLGTALLFIVTFALWLFRGSMKNRIVCLLLTIVLGGVLYGATRLSAYFGSALWSTVNVYYALMIGFIAFLVTRNAKYGFIASVLSVMAATLLTQIGGPVSLNPAYTPAVIAGGLSVVMYSLTAALMPRKPSKMSYYFETGRMTD
ncbi:MAG: hypothetical protein ACI4M8_04500 [Christensenellales bacterium]